MNANGYSSSQWPTPATRDHKGANGPEHLQNGTGRLHLDQLPNFVAHCWPTPAVTDSNGARNRTSGRSNPDSKHHDGVTLNDAIILYSRPVPAISPDGAPSSIERRTLNPRFVSWLMGWPHGWTNSACSATELSHWKQRMRFALSQLGSPHEAPPAQISLFG